MHIDDCRAGSSRLGHRFLMGRSSNLQMDGDPAGSVGETGERGWGCRLLTFCPVEHGPSTRTQTLYRQSSFPWQMVAQPTFANLNCHGFQAARVRLLLRVVSVEIGPVVAESSRTTAAKTRMTICSRSEVLVCPILFGPTTSQMSRASLPRVFHLSSEFSCHSRHGTRRPRDPRNARDGWVSINCRCQAAHLSLPTDSRVPDSGHGGSRNA